MTAARHPPAARRSPPATATATADLVAELRLLRKGRGVHASRAEQRIGPALRAACGIADSTQCPEVATRVSDWLRDRIALLPPDLRICALAAFALHESVRLQFYRERVAWVARHLDRDFRTARRRIDRAIDLLVEMALFPDVDADTLRGYRDRPVALTASLCEVREPNTVEYRCHVLTVAHDPDDPNRLLAVIELLDDTRHTIVIPITRIHRVEEISDKTAA